MRRRLFNLFAFAFLAFAIYLVAFKKEDPSPHAGQTARAMDTKSTASISLAR